jgi:hypothetical protein
MSTGLIIAIIVVVLLLIGLLVMLPRMRAKADERKARRELESRRERVATEHRETASARAGEADRAEQEAEIAQQKARAERAEAERHEAEAKMHERGLADDRLVEDDERDRFSGVTGGNGTTDADRRTDDERARAGAGEPPAGEATAEEGGAATRPDTEYERGREDEAATRESRRP